MKALCMSAVMLLAGVAFSQDSLKTQKLDDVTVYSTRANENTPMTYSSLSKEDIQKRNLGQDLPILLNFTPSIVTTSDAGAGVGYTGMRIRGSDATRINVTINGVPVNDSESHGVFWVNMPDFSSSLSSIQIQRGVGTSSNGAGAFGATVNLKTSNVSRNPFFQSDNSFGSFNTWKSNLTFNTGLINNRFNFEGRLSKITSDGFVDRSAADLKSYYLSGGSYGERTMIKAVIFGGHEITQQAWYGTPEAVLNGGEDEIENLIAFSGEYSTPEQLQNVRNADRTFNYYLYDNEIDNYRQDHYQLHLGHTFSESLNLTMAGHYTRGRGYFEQFKGDEELSDYGLDSIEVGSEKIGASDIIVRRWLDNHFYGATFSLSYQQDALDITFGGAANQYIGDHFGEIIWMQYAGTTDIRDRYYEGDATKNDINAFVKANYDISDRINAFADMQVRNVAYETEGVDNDLNPYSVDESLTFFNPKFGLTYALTNEMSVYGSFAIGNREPVRSDYIDANPGEIPSHETLQNVEMGVRKYGTSFSYEANFYFMNYENQLVLTGAVNDVGSGIRVNVPKSYRAGIELSTIYKLSDQVTWNANLALSRNKIDQFTEVAFDYGEDFSGFSEVRIDHEDTDIAYSPSVVAGSILSFDATNNLSIELMTKYVGKQYLDNTSNDDRAIDPYLTNDVRIAYNFNTDFAKNLQLSLLVNNVLNKEYSSNGYTWGYYYGPTNLYQQNNYYPQAGRNFLAAVSMRF
ncbi:TonB-dependent receptor [Ekhidna sp.]|uniref:TonB-dependent receptor n=1 Tax=Ekhidna sp. TaxID=2608089 RepID=UPI003518080E